MKMGTNAMFRILLRLVNILAYIAHSFSGCFIEIRKYCSSAVYSPFWLADVGCETYGQRLACGNVVLFMGKRTVDSGLYHAFVDCAWYQ